MYLPNHQISLPFFTNYADSALVIMYIYFIEKQGDILGVTSNMNMEILASFNKAGLNFAFPTQTIYIQKDESDDNIGKTNNSPETKISSFK